jgi:putative membrane protein
VDAQIPQIPDDRKATEHLANERTFLAWVRTSIAIMSLGFVVAKFGLWLRELATRLSPQSPTQGSGLSGPVGMGMIAFGGALALLAAWRFHTVNRQIERGQVSVDRGLVGLVSITMAALAVLMMAYIGLTTTRP